MSSRIATKLLVLPISNPELSEVLWKYADLDKAEEINCVPPAKYVKEFVTLLDGKRVTELVAKVPSSKVLDELVSSSTSKDVLVGIISNPYTSNETLEKIKALDLGLEDEIKITNSQLSDKYTTDAQFSLRDIELSLNDGTLSKFYAKVNSYGDARVAKLFRNLINEDSKLTSLLVMTALEAGNRLDILMVDFLYSNESFMNEAIIIKLEDRLKLRGKAEQSLTPAAYEYLISKGHVTVASGNSNSTGTDEAMGRTLLATGLDESVIAPLLLGSNTSVIDSNFLVKMLSKSSDGLVSQFVTGTSERKPRKGEIDLLFKTIGLDRTKKITAEHAENLMSLDWSEELIISAPLLDLEKIGLASTFVLNEILSDRLQSDIPAWELFLVMSEEWEDTIDSLLSSANIMSVLS